MHMHQQTIKRIMGALDDDAEQVAELRAKFEERTEDVKL